MREVDEALSRAFALKGASAPSAGQGATAAPPVARMTSVELPDDPNVFNTFEEREFAHDEYLDRLEELLPEFSAGGARPATAGSAAAGAR